MTIYGNEEQENRGEKKYPSAEEKEQYDCVD